MTETAAVRPANRVFIDKQHPDAYRALTATAQAAKDAAAAAGIDRRLVELVNLRVSQLNACAYCLALHTRAALRAGETTLRLGVLAAWRDTELFTPRERAALALAEATTQTAAYAQAHATLSADEISAVVWVAITINAFNRVSVMSKHPVRESPVPVR
ncbi:carboxymuconolactone decarboxylase family protein [Streptomyces sp. AC627_RSS907]|uniref:carboxymuconolactone decarboxylase family protein n=1 Tax=Streptomyces sp. AC627_RSS907 TaxID=2823684 RepID=UPI001C2271A7|nr:carboxymuconolactone decarboxylase family protein [Streptomyces sp. AC627_RSS907]